MEEIIVKSQQELDAIPDDYDGRIVIKFGTADDPAVVARRFKWPVRVVEDYCVRAMNNSSVVAWDNNTVVAYDNSSVVAWDNSSVVAWDNSSVVAWDNSSVEAHGSSSVVAYDNSSVVAYDNSSVVAYENSTVEAYDNSSVVAWGNSSVVAWGNSSVKAYENSTVEAYDNNTVVAYDNSSVVAYDNSSVVAYENSSVEAYDNSSVVAWGNSSVVAWGNSSVKAYGNGQVLDVTRMASIAVFGNSRLVYLPCNVESYLEYYNLVPADGKIRLYKAVHKVGALYVSDWDSAFEYQLSEIAEVNRVDTNTLKPCGEGINVAPLHWGLKYGQYWNDLAILEVECDVDSLVVPINTDGKVRTKKVKVLREVPLEECGVLGKIIAKRKSRAEGVSV